MAANKIIIYFNKFEQSYFVRLEFDNPNIIYLVEGKPLKEYEKSCLRNFYPDNKDVEEVLDSYDPNKDEDGFNGLKRYIEKYNVSLSTLVQWRKYDSLKDKIEACSEKENIKLNSQYESDVLVFVSEVSVSDLSTEYLKAQIKLHMKSAKASEKEFAVYKCHKCGRYSIIKQGDRPVCDNCSSLLNDLVFDGSYSECSRYLQNLSKKSSISSLEDDEVFIVFGRKYHSNNSEDVVRLHQALFDNFSPSSVFIKNEYETVSFNPKFKSFILKSEYKSILEEFSVDQFSLEIESTFLIYLFKFKEVFNLSSLKIYACVPYKGDALRSIKDYLLALLNDPALISYFEEEFYYRNFFKLGSSQRNKLRALSALYYKELKAFAYYDASNKVVIHFNDDLLSNLVRTSDEKEISRRKTYISEYLVYFNSFPGLEESFLISELDTTLVLSYSDYDALSYYDYVLTGKKMYRYKETSLSLNYKEPTKYQENIFNALKDIYLYSYEDMDKSFASFMDAILSPTFKLIFNETNNELYQKMISLKESGNCSILNMYLLICPEIDLKTIEFNIDSNKGTLINISKNLLLQKSPEEIKRFVALKDVSDIMKHHLGESSYKDFISASRRDFDKFMDL